VKDNIAVRGLRTTCGAAEFCWVPPFDAVAVERLLAAGAACVGKANMEPFAFGRTGTRSEFGAVRNPRDDRLISGGSSSGSTAAVAVGLVDAALGTDTGGSVRVPAACCGVVGVNPSAGLAPRHGVVPLDPATNIVVGPMASDVATAADVLAVAHRALSSGPRSGRRVSDRGSRAFRFRRIAPRRSARAGRARSRCQRRGGCHRGSHRLRGRI